MEKTTTKRNARLPFVRITSAEKEQIKKDYLASPFTSQSAYLRYKLLGLGDAKTAKKEMEVVLLMGIVADEMKGLSEQIIQLVRLRKAETSDQVSPEEAYHLSKMIKSIQEINTQFNKNKHL